MQWQEKLYHYSEEPPEATWENLKKVLEQEPFQLKKSLYDLEETPPPQAWDNIKAGIQPVVEKETARPAMIFRFSRVMAYAAVLAATILTITALVNLIRDERALDSSKFSTSITQRDSQRKSNSSSAELKKVEEPQIIYSDKNYILIASPEGGYNRVSRKFTEMYQMIYSPDNRNPSDKQYWHNTLNQWKAKMEHSSFMPSGTNFFDLAEMVSVLEEKQ